MENDWYENIFNALHNGKIDKAEILINRAIENYKNQGRKLYVPVAIMKVPGDNIYPIIIDSEILTR